MKTGDKFWRLTVISVEPKGRALVECECGKQKRVFAGNVRSGKTQSCGCLQKERVRELQSTHGLSKSPEYRIWADMWGRCTNSKRVVWPHYGGRGIKVCKRWRSFEAFLKDMGPRPSARHSLDRIDVNGDYEPRNCRWAHSIMQARNRRNTRLVTVGSETRPLTEWAEVANIPPQRIRNRLRRGKSPQEAVFGGKHAVG